MDSPTSFPDDIFSRTPPLLGFPLLSRILWGPRSSPTPNHPLGDKPQNFIPMLFLVPRSFVFLMPLLPQGFPFTLVPGETRLPREGLPPSPSFPYPRRCTIGEHSSRFFSLPLSAPICLSTCGSYLPPPFLFLLLFNPTHSSEIPPTVRFPYECPFVQIPVSRCDQNNWPPSRPLLRTFRPQDFFF